MKSSELARFETTVLPYLDAAHTLARYLTRSEHDAQDVVQDACLRALRYFDGYRGDPGSSARAWLLAIVRNTAYTWRRRRRADARPTEFDDSEHSQSMMEDQQEDLPLDGQETLARALGRLPPELREVIVLRELEGLAYREIGEVAGVPIGAVMSRLSRARTRLLEALRNEEGGGP